MVNAIQLNPEWRKPITIISIEWFLNSDKIVDCILTAVEISVGEITMYWYVSSNHSIKALVGYELTMNSKNGKQTIKIKN